VWENITRRIKIAPLLGKVDCPCCKHRRFEWLEGEQGSQTTSLCGRNAVQISHRSAAKLNFEEMASHLKLMGGEVSFNRFLLKFTAEAHEFTVFPDGRAIIKGTSDLDKARVLYAKYIGH
jgi:adenylyltransferase/sulfurtransferase